MKNPIKRVFLMLAVGVFVAGCGSDGSAESVSPAPARAATSADPSPATTTSALPADPGLTSETAPTQHVSVTAAQLKAYQCTGGPKCDDTSPVQARNQAEAEWLYRNGYPSQAQLDEWAALSDDQLKRVAASGNVAALAVYAERVAKGGNVMGGLAMTKAATYRVSQYS